MLAAMRMKARGRSRYIVQENHSVSCAHPILMLFTLAGEALPLPGRAHSGVKLLLPTIRRSAKLTLPFSPGAELNKCITALVLNIGVTEVENAVWSSGVSH